MPSIESNPTSKGTVLVPATSKTDPAAFCRDRCKLLGNFYFILLEILTKCQCVPKVPLGGNH
jgi:hypothetical protein